MTARLTSALQGHRYLKSKRVLWDVCSSLLALGRGRFRVDVRDDQREWAQSSTREQRVARYNAPEAR